MEKVWNWFAMSVILSYLLTGLFFIIKTAEPTKDFYITSSNDAGPYCVYQNVLYGDDRKYFCDFDRGRVLMIWQTLREGANTQLEGTLKQ